MAETTQVLSASAARHPLFVGVDVGGTNIKLGIVDDSGRTVAYRSIATEEGRGAPDAAKRIGGAFHDLAKASGLEEGAVARLGLATPGPMDISSGILVEPGNLPHWHNSPIRDLVGDACGLPVTFANDANAAAYGEFWAGAAQQYRSMVLFTMGTGIGGGIIVDEMLIEGVHSCGGELGHIIIDSHDDAPVNSLGIRGSLEGYCGAYGVIRRAEEALQRGGASSLQQRIAGGEELTPLVIAEEAEGGDQLALDVIMETARYMAIGAVTAIHTIDPESIVIGGAMTFGGEGHPLGERFMARLRQEAVQRMIASLRDKVHIDFAALGGDAGYIGAAGLARREYWAARTAR
ncbi:MAG: ROK family protein [Pirellulales bacterium]|nr:ROK family protein [Pirellulales bacterium]